MTRKAEQDARAALASARKELADYDAQEKKAAATVAAATKKLDAELRRSPLVVIEAGNDHHAMRLANITLGWGGPKTEKEALDAMIREKDAVKLKLPVGSGLEYALVSVARRGRIPTEADAATLSAKWRAVEKAEAALRKARDEFLLARQEAHKNGSKLSADQVAAAVAHAAPIRAVAESRRYASMEDWRRREKARSVEIAETHLAAMKAGTECGCSPCLNARKEAERKEAEMQRRAALPKMLVTCEQHGTHRLPIDRRDLWIDNRRCAGYPTALCSGHSLALADVYEAEQKAAAKAAMKAAKEAKKAA